jgi:DNA-binding CsgD family transcriptional regulator
VTGFQRFSPELAEVLSNAVRTLRYVTPGDHRRLYSQWRVTMGTIAPVDSFYIAFFHADRVLVVPYIFDEKEYEPSGFQMYGPAGLAGWIRNNAKPYLYSMDNGRLLNMGHTFGDEERLSGDAIAIPLLEPLRDGQAVVGLASMQTYRKQVYTEEIAHAFEWLARSVMTALTREREDLATQTTLSPAGADEASGPISIMDVIEDVAHKLGQLRSTIGGIIEAAPSSRDELMLELARLYEMCEAAHIETTELLMVPSTEGRNLLALLTPREQEIAQLISEDLGNNEIAERLVISEPTVRTHVTHILKKFGVRQRSAVAAKLRPFD